MRFGSSPDGSKPDVVDNRSQTIGHTFLALIC
jgi:hypothetical protein